MFAGIDGDGKYRTANLKLGRGKLLAHDNFSLLLEDDRGNEFLLLKTGGMVVRKAGPCGIPILAHALQGEGRDLLPYPRGVG